MKDGALKGKMWVGEIAGGSKNRRTREREKKWTLQVFLDDVSWSYIVIWRVDIIKENGVCVPAYKGSVGRIKKTVTTYTGLDTPSLPPPSLPPLPAPTPALLLYLLLFLHALVPGFVGAPSRPPLGDVWQRLAPRRLLELMHKMIVSANSKRLIFLCMMLRPRGLARGCFIKFLQNRCCGPALCFV